MRINRLCMMGIVAGLTLMACQHNSSSVSKAPTGDPQVVATVNGVSISSQDLEAAASAQLKQVESQIYQIKKNVLDDMIEEKLIADAARKAGKSVESYLKEEVESKITAPTEEELKQFYDQRKAQIGERSFADVKDQIKQVLTQSRRQNVRQTLIGKLRASAEVKIHLEPPRVAVEAGDNPSRGPKGAPIQIVEWTDYQCPYCGRSRPTLNQILTTYGDKVRYVLRDFPLRFHQNSFKAHEAAHCAGAQGKYWEMNQQLFSHAQALEVPKLKEYARQLQLNGAKFDKCLDSGKFKEKVQKNMDAGAAVGVSGTPSFFINGINISGARSFEDFKSIIDGELSR